MKNIPLTNKEKDILDLAIYLLDGYYEKEEADCRKFKNICHEHLPQYGDEYVKNLNVFEIQDKTIADIHRKKGEATALIMKLINTH